MLALQRPQQCISGDAEERPEWALTLLSQHGEAMDRKTLKESPTLLSGTRYQQALAAIFGSPVKAGPDTSRCETCDDDAT